MLVLSRSKDESVMLGDELEVMVLKVRGRKALLTVYRAVRGKRLMWEAAEPRWLGVSETWDLGEGMSCHVVDVCGEKVRLGFCVPRSITPHRREIYDLIRGESGMG